MRRAGEARDVNAAEITISDVVIVKPGGLIPVDGAVVGGNSFVDQATITGESLPVEKTSGDHVYAGTMNQSGMLEIRTTGIGRGRFDQVQHLLRMEQPDWVFRR